jgi:hypothetical protein
VSLLLTRGLFLFSHCFAPLFSFPHSFMFVHHSERTPFLAEDWQQ